MSDYLNSLSGKEIQFRVNACVSKGMLKNVEHFEADCETIEGALPFKAVTTQKFGAGNTYTKVITLRQNVAEGKAPYLLSEPAPPADMNAPRPESNRAEVPEGLNPNANMDYLASIDHGYTTEQIALMEANSIIPPGTPQPIITDYLAVCKMRGANPFLKDIYLIKHKSEKYGDKYTKVDSIGFARKKAMETGKMAGTTFLFNGLTEDVWGREAGPTQVPDKITCIIFRREFADGKRDKYTYTINASEYIKAGENNPIFRAYKTALLTKCCNMAALRLAFPEVLAEAYIEEEFQKEKQDLASVSFQQGTVLLSLPEASAKLDIIANIQDLAERKKALQEVYTSTEHLQDTDLMTRISDMTNA
jgi:hypothetical protein